MMFPGILQNTLGQYNIDPWSSLQLDAIPTMLEYYSVVFDTSNSSYSISYGYDQNKLISAICKFGKHYFFLKNLTYQSMRSNF